MTIDASRKIKTGGLVLISILLLLALIFLIGRNKNLFGNTFTIYANFKNISGTREGNFVRFAGINVGTVSEITLINDTTVQLKLQIESAVRRHLKTDAIATIGSDGLMGDKLVILHAGNPSLSPVRDGETIQSINPLDADKILNNLSRISMNADSITTGLSSIINKINNGEGAVGRMMTNEGFAKKLEGTIDKASDAVGTIKKTASSVNENMEAAKHNFLLRGYFRKKEKQRIKDSLANTLKNPVDPKKDKQ